MKQFTIVTSAPSAEFEIHRTGCAHLRRPDMMMRNSYPVAAETATEALATEVAEYAEEAKINGYDLTEPGTYWNADHFRIMPCATK